MRQSPRIAWVQNQVRSHYGRGRILDIGFAGEYREPFLHLSLRRQNPEAEIFGVDLDAGKVFQRRLPRSLPANAMHLPFRDSSFDAVLVCELLEHIYNPAAILLEIWRVLRAQKALILTTPNAWSWWSFLRHWMAGSLSSRANPKIYRKYLGDGDHKHFYDPLSLMNLLDDAGFRTVRIATKNHAVPVIRRFFKRLDCLDWQFWPMDRLGNYLCLVAQKQHCPRSSIW